MTRPRLLSIGDIDMDVMIAVDALPDHGGKVTGRRTGRFPGGMAANVAVASARLGCAVRMMGTVGDDADGRDALAALAEAGVDTAACTVRTDAPTFVCVVLLTLDGEKALVRLDTPAFMPRAEDLTEALFEDIDHVHLNYGDPELAARAIAMAAAAGATVSLDLEAADIRGPSSPALAELLPQVDLLFTNAVAAERLAGHAGARAVVTTRGQGGAEFRGPSGAARAPGHDVVARDTTGAGDCFAAAFLSRYLVGDPPEECLVVANAAAALSTQAYGAQGVVVGPERIARFRAALADGRGAKDACRIAMETCS